MFVTHHYHFDRGPCAPCAIDPETAALLRQFMKTMQDLTDAVKTLTDNVAKFPTGGQVVDAVAFDAAVTAINAAAAALGALEPTAPAA